MSQDISQLLIQKAEQVKAGTEILLAKTRDWQVIKQYMCNRLGDITLTATQEKKLERYQFIYNQLVSGKYTEQDVITQVMKFYNIKLTQAYEDLNACREVFVAVINVNKQFELKMELESARDVRRKCIEIGDFKSAEAARKNIIEILKLLPDSEDNPAEMFEGHTIEAVFDPALLGGPPVDMKELLSRINEKRNKKIKTDLFIEDIPFEENQKVNGR